MNFDDAKAQCETENSKLAIPRSGEALKLFQALSLDNNLPKSTNFDYFGTENNQY